MVEMVEAEYDLGTAFIIDNEEPCGYVAYDEIVDIREGPQYRVERCSPSGEVISRITLDDEDIADGLEDGIVRCDNATSAMNRILNQ